jgi:FkbH-like protein
MSSTGSRLPDGVAEARLEPKKVRALWRDWDGRPNRIEDTPALRIGLAASFTVNPLVPYLGGHLLAADIKSAIEVGPFNQLFQVCLDHASAFHRKPDVLVLLWRIEELMEKEITAFLHGDQNAAKRALSKLGEFRQALGSLRSAFAGTIIVNLPPFPATLPVHSLELTNPGTLGTLHRAIVSGLVESISGMEGVRLFDLDMLQREHGLAGSSDARQWYLYHQPFTDRFLFEAGALLSRTIATLTRTPRKCVVLDCDNTLWGGIVGEDGVGGLQLGEDFPGWSYRDFQKLLLRWRQQGILLALASKNNEADVWEVFEKHSGMILKREHISAWQINWEPKSENIPKIAKALNIGTDSLVFIDDNPVEIDYMRAARPEVHSVLVPEEPAEILGTMRALTHFDRLEITKEDRQRADMIRLEQERESAHAHLSKEEFLGSLGIKVALFEGAPEDLDRITQLINKTNQFNLSTIRRSVDQVRQLGATPQHRLYGLKVTDRFGEYGLTGVAITIANPEKKRTTIDTLLMSCRVLGRKVETAFLAGLAADARADGAEEMHATFVPTAKNAPSASFLPDHGFQILEGDTWRAAVTDIPGVPECIILNRS